MKQGPAKSVSPHHTQQDPSNKTHTHTHRHLSWGAAQHPPDEGAAVCVIQVGMELECDHAAQAATATWPRSLVKTHTHNVSTPLLRHWFPKCFLRALASSPTLNPVDRAIAHQEATKMKTSCPRAWAPAPFLAQPSSAPLRRLLPLRSPSHLRLQQTCWVFIIWFQAGMMVSAVSSLGTEQAVGRQGFSPGPQCSTDTAMQLHLLLCSVHRHRPHPPDSGSVCHCNLQRPSLASLGRRVTFELFRS